MKTKRIGEQGLIKDDNLLEWFPKSEAGNVYYSGIDNTICNYHNLDNCNLAFATFSDWLIFYLDIMDM